jgi:hypothetical protein
MSDSFICPLSSCISILTTFPDTIVFLKVSVQVINFPVVQCGEGLTLAASNDRSVDCGLTNYVERKSASPFLM